MQARVHWSIVTITHSHNIDVNTFHYSANSVVGSSITEEHILKKLKKYCFPLPLSSRACFSSNVLLPLSVSSTKPNSTVVLLEAHEMLPNSHHVQLAPPVLQPVAQTVFLWLSSLPLWFCSLTNRGVPSLMLIFL